MRAPVLPSARLLLAVPLCLASAVLCTVLVRQPAWLGLTFEHTAAGTTLRVADVSPAAAALGIHTGNSLVAVAAPGAAAMALETRDLHDTVSSPLLAGLAPHAASDEGDAQLVAVQNEIRRAVRGMRSVVSGETVSAAPLADCLADARGTTPERLAAASFGVTWPGTEVRLTAPRLQLAEQS